jgi:hypothetical protein
LPDHDASGVNGDLITYTLSATYPYQLADAQLPSIDYFSRAADFSDANSNHNREEKMKNERDLTRRASLGLIGTFGASVMATGCGGGGDASASSDSANSVTSRDAALSSNGVRSVQDEGNTDALRAYGIDNCSQDLRLPHTASTSVDAVAAHAAAELTNDLGTILSSISAWDQNYAILTVNSDGSLNLKSAFTPDEIRQYYTANVAAFRTLPGEGRLNEVAGRWYDLVDTRASFAVLPDGPTLTGLRGVFLFLTWPDGIIGEIFWPEPSWVKPFAVEDPKELTAKLIAYENAWQSGNVDARLAAIEDQTCSSIGIAGLNTPRRKHFVAKTKDELRTAWNSPEAGTVVEFKRLHHVVSTYYVFAAYRTVLKVDDHEVVRETATLLPIGPNRKFIGELSYSLEAELSR